MAQVRNIYVLGLNDFNRRKLERLRGAGHYRYHGILDPDRILEGTEFPVAQMLQEAESQIAAAAEPPDAIIGYVDFPVSTMVPLLARRFGVPAPSLESLLKCEHKYWSRLVQREAIPEHVPRFQAFDPFDDRALERMELDYPFWVKPIKSAGSFLGFRIGDAEQFEHARAAIREQIHIFADPFNYILEQTELPPEVAAVDGRHCIAESIIGGRQCTLEGYVFRGEVHYHGLVDSIRARNKSTFLRYQYPSRLPVRIRRRMRAIARRVMEHIGYDNAAFNIEFYWDSAADRIWLLEINTRIAQHHSELFEKVDGVSNHQVVVDVALGTRPDFPHRRGAFRYAACCFLRHYRDGVVESVPGDADVEAVRKDIPELVFEPHVQPGTRLSELTHQESYSYVLALVYAGADNPQGIRDAYQACRRRLRFRIRDCH
ncbi:MAG TPA: ATP-grasp domain-containing protein [Gammaproteobacteria bacterium]|nr:ATP-grasp domain-containing protein [Gammaproteobacteria bacterium]